MVGNYYVVTDHTTTLSCPECGCWTYVNEDQCYDCDLDFTTTFLPDEVATFNTDQLIFDHDYDSEDLTYERDLPKDGPGPFGDIHKLFEEYQNDEISKQYSLGQTPVFTELLCCNQDRHTCSCSEQVGFLEAANEFDKTFMEGSPFNYEDALYATSAIGHDPLCMSCDYYGQYHCKPLRNALRMAHFNPNALEYSNIMMELIEPCDEFEPGSHATAEEIEEVVVFIKSNKSMKLAKQEPEVSYDLRAALENENYYSSTYWEE